MQKITRTEALELLTTIKAPHTVQLCPHLNRKNLPKRVNTDNDDRGSGSIKYHLCCDECTGRVSAEISVQDGMVAAVRHEIRRSVTPEQ